MRVSSSTTNIRGQVLGRAVWDHLCDSAGSSAHWINRPPKQQVYASGRARAPPKRCTLGLVSRLETGSSFKRLGMEQMEHNHCFETCLVSAC